ncbi:mitochondrial porin-like protein [Aulographum hederae CBS 113979]|uniref:Mitochondrial porin-like protein n=1 Tax=Aulographum hederae CBS 113979 TaxID=1176131 RepID=A0A6G1HCN8_9PEZI|nr:mitochondrial porin-like protein [Aulographum hederae CBS 113979]
MESKPVTVNIPVPKAPSGAPPPAFSDIGKSAGDLINRDFYHAVAASLEVKLKSANGVAFTTKGTSPHGAALSASVEGKKALDKGIAVTQSWASSDVLTTKVELDNTITNGLKAELVGNFSPSKGAKGQKLSLFFKQPQFHLRSFSDYAPGGAITTVLDAVVGYEGFLVGGEAGYDVQKATVTRYSAALGYTTPAYAAALTATNNLSIFSASYYQKVNSAVEVGTKAAYDVKSSSTVGIELASKYKIDPLSFAKAKINDRGIASIAYNTKVNSGFTFGIGASFDTQKLNEAGHKIGASFTFEG